MPFRVYCDNDTDTAGLRCRKEMEPVIDKITKVVYCTECGQPLKNQDSITVFAKNQMLAMGQVRKEDKKRQAFSVKCVECEKEAQPSLGKDGRTLVCSFCKKPMKNLSPPFAQMLKENLKARKTGRKE